MVGCSLRHRGEELLGLGGGLPAYLDHGAVFGIPLLYPWANRLGGWGYEACGRKVELDRDSPLLHGDEHCLPIHGALAAASDWRLTDRGPSWLTAELDFGAHPELLAVFPFPHVLELAIRLEARRARRSTTTVTAGRESAVPLSFGFHPYLAPPGAAREDWWVELPARTALELDSLSLPTGAAPSSTPRRSRSEPARSTTCSRWRRARGSRSPAAVAALTVELTSGYRYAQVFAPADQPVICFEPMTAPVDALRSHDGLRSVPPGGSARATFTLRVDEPA